VYEAEAAGGKRACKMNFAIPRRRDLAAKTISEISYNIYYL